MSFVAYASLKFCSPKHMWAKLNTNATENNFQNKTGTKHLTHNPHLHPCKQNPASATSLQWISPDSLHRFRDENHLLMGAGQRARSRRFPQFFFILTWVNIFQLFSTVDWSSQSIEFLKKKTSYPPKMDTMAVSSCTTGYIIVISSQNN